jgi:hypothetical protein
MPDKYLDIEGLGTLAAQVKLCADAASKKALNTTDADAAKTVTGFDDTTGKAIFGNIAIDESQVANLSTDLDAKAEKVTGATSGNFASLDSSGNLADSGKSSEDFASAAQGDKADSAIQSISVNGGAQQPDVNKNVDISVPTGYSSVPEMDGTGNAGVSPYWAHGDHVHPSDTSREAVSNKTTSVRQSGIADNTKYPSEAAVRNAIDSIVSSAYRAAGTKQASELVSSLLVAANEGDVYNITTDGTTTADFVEGAGKPIKAGDNVGVCKVGNDYKFDLLSGFVDLSDYYTKSDTDSLLEAKQATVNTDTDENAFGDNTTIATGFGSDKVHLNLASRLWAYISSKVFSDNGKVPASNIPDSIKSKVVFIDASFNIATQVFTCNDASYNDITGYLLSGKVPVIRVSVYENSSATTPVRIHELYYHGYDSQVESPNTGKYKFGSTDGYEDGSRAYVTSIKCNDSTGWSDYQDYAVPSLTRMSTALIGKVSTTGDASNTTSTFTKASGDTSSMTSGGKLSEIFTAISSFFASLKALAFKDKASYDDLSSGVQTSLGKADTAYQLPSTGIPSTALASAVQTSLGKADSALQYNSTSQSSGSYPLLVNDSGTGKYNSGITMDMATMVINALTKGLHKTIIGSTAVDLNDLTIEHTTGNTNASFMIYEWWIAYKDNVTHKPINAAGTLIVFGYNSDSCCQIAYMKGSSGLFFRSKNGSWSDWVNIRNASLINSGTFDMERIPTASSVTSGDTTHVPTCDAVAQAVANKANTNGTYPNMTVGNVSSVADSRVSADAVSGDRWYKVADTPFDDTFGTRNGSWLITFASSESAKANITSLLLNVSLRTQNATKPYYVYTNGFCSGKLTANEFGAKVVSRGVMGRGRKLELWVKCGGDGSYRCSVLTKELAGKSYLLSKTKQFNYYDYTGAGSAAPVTDESNNVYAYEPDIVYAPIGGKGSPTRPVYVASDGSVKECDTSVAVNPGNLDLTSSPYTGYSVGYILDVVNTGVSMIYITTGNGSTGVPTNGSRRFCKTESNKWTYVTLS